MTGTLGSVNIGNISVGKLECVLTDIDEVVSKFHSNYALSEKLS